MIHSIRNTIQAYASKINWQLLIFLVMIVDVKLVVKIAAVIIFSLIRVRSLTGKNAARPAYLLFYVSVLIIGLINLIFFGSSFPAHYFPVFIIGAATWIICIVVGLILADLVRQSSLERLWFTVTAFFILNIIISLAQFGWMVADSGSLNPYRFQGMFQKYWINTGDGITGLSFDVCSTNALMSAMGVFFFLYRQKMMLAITCMLIVLMTSSNFTNILLLLIFIVVLLSRANSNKKSVIIVCISMMLLFLLRVSPQNSQYLEESFAKFSGQKKTVPVIHKAEPIALQDQPDSLLNKEELKRKVALLYMDSINRERLTIHNTVALPDLAAALPSSKPSLPVEPIHTVPYQRRRDSTAYQKKLVRFRENYLDNNPTFPVLDTNIFRAKGPGKYQSVLQLKKYFASHPSKLILGMGMGNFSSKLAFKATGLGVAGGFPKRWMYLHPAFASNHLGLYIHYFSMDIGSHSFTNSPNVVYTQLLSEYGIAGLLSFLAFYFLYFWRIKGGYALPLVLLMLGSQWVDYWLEQVSILVLFELLMLIRKKEIEIGNGI